MKDRALNAERAPADTQLCGVQIDATKMTTDEQSSISDFQGTDSETGSLDELESPAKLVEKIADGKLRAFAGTIDLETGTYLDDVYAQNKSLSEHTAADYHGRFLIELIQNANDVHERGQQSGEIEICLFEDEGEHGTLYVANLGKPFSYENVLALSRIGMSSKPPGEAIGNKGLGFRSVSHVCDNPEIYSQRPASVGTPTFKGFCFTFARSEDLPSRIENPTVLRLAQLDLPMFFLPVALDDQPITVRRFAERGFSTVIRLPLRDRGSLETAKDELRALEDPAAPLLLFLDRLKRLEASITTSAGIPSELITLERHEKEIRTNSVRAAIVTLGETEWLILRDEVPETLMLKAIDDGVAAKQLHSSWKEWSGAGEVALAVPITDEIVSPRLYTFLPMGEGATAPFQGHLHGSFFPTSNRKALDAGVELNRLLLMRAATLAASGLKWLVERAATREIAVDANARANVAVDLLVWQNPSSLISAKDAQGQLDLAKHVVAEVSRLAGDEFAAARVIPCATITAGLLALGWRSAKNARASFERSVTFDLVAVSRHGASLPVPVCPIWPELGDQRRGRLSAFLAVHAPSAYREHLTADECANIAASVAASLRAGRRPATSHWTAFYRDLPAFMRGRSDVLTGHAVILCDDGTVRAGRSSLHVETGDAPRPRRRRRRGEDIEPSLFFPPAPRPSDVAGDTQFDQLKVPTPLARYFAFAANTLPWHGELRLAREFLERGQVSAYDGETVLTRISQVVNAGASVEEAIAGLRWAFAIWRRAVQANRPIKIDSSYRLLVPTADALIPATEAIFSESWPEELLGKRLHALFSIAPPDVADFAEFRKKFLAPTSHRAFGRGRVSFWADFLKALGVRSGLRALPLPTMPSTRAYEVTSFGFATKLGLSDAAIGHWRSDVLANNREALSLGYTTMYHFTGPLWSLPGQGDFERFSDDCREIYAGLVIEWLAEAPNDIFKVELRHDYFSSDCREWPTPVGAFLRSGGWMPADDPSPDGPIRRYLPPSEVWVSGAANERFPFFLRQVAVSVGKIIERRQPEALRRLRSNAGLRVLNNSSTAVEQACFLAQQFAARTVRHHYEPQFVNLCNGTWKLIADKHAADQLSLEPADADMPVVVRQRGQLTVAVPGREPGKLYVRDSDDELAPSLLASLGGLLLDVKGVDRAKLSAAVDRLFGDKVTRLSAMQYGVKVNGADLDDLNPATTVLDACPWLRVMFAIAMEGLRGTDATQLPADRRTVLAKLNDIGFLTADQVSFEIDGQTITAPGDRPAFVFRRSVGNLVVLRHIGSLDWPGLQLCIPAICDAIDLPTVANGVRLIAHELASIGEEIDDLCLDDDLVDRLCRVLQLEDGSRTTVQLLAGTGADMRLPWIRAAVHYCLGSNKLLQCDHFIDQHASDTASMIAALNSIFDTSEISWDELLAACRQAQTAAQFRELMGFDFGRFNESLLASGSDPVTYAAVHASQLLNYIVENEVMILEALRNKIAPQLESFEPSDEYANQRDSLRSWLPDPDWLTRFHFVPDDVLGDHVSALLARVGAPTLGSNPHELPPLSDVRSANLDAIRRFAVAAVPVIRAWWRGPASSLPDYWRDVRATEQQVRARLDATGVVDFKPLTEDRIIAWCAKLGLWPLGMELTLDREILGIGEAEVDAAAKEAQREVDERAAKARSVRVNGRDIDPEQADWTAISAEIAARMSRKVKSMRLTASTELEPLSKGARRNPGERKPTDKPPGHDRTPQAKKDMIGHLGELVVYHWLKDKFRNQDIDKAWVSRFGALQKGKAWSDDLGYDFELKHDRRTWLLEVKSSQGDRCQFEMGESEVRAARDAARPRSGVRYAIIYVANPATSDETRIDILPNPMSDEADGVLRLLGEGVRFGFQPK